MTRPPQHLIHISVDADDALDRYRKLTLALVTVLVGRTLIRIDGADYEHGHIEVVVEAEKLIPLTIPTEFHVAVEHWPLPAEAQSLHLSAA